MRERKSLLSDTARVQAPWVKVTIGEFTFGVFDRKSATKNGEGFYAACGVQYPNYIQGLTITKINGQVNQYTLDITYPIRPQDDPNFFEKIFSSVSNTRKITFSYGDSSAPAYCYKNEEALITKITQQFNLAQSSISYKVMAVSAAKIGLVGNFTFNNSRRKKPSDEIRDIFFAQDDTYGLRSIFTGIKDEQTFWALVDGHDKEVELETKVNISPLEYLSYLVSCMVTEGAGQTVINKDIYILTIHDDTTFNGAPAGENPDNITGPYFKVTRTTYNTEQADAYELDIGYNTTTLVSNFSISQDENYSIYYEYANEKYPQNYRSRINNEGKMELIYAPTLTSGNSTFKARPEDASWYTKLTKYPISATVTVQGLLRPATLMQYLRLNVIFPGGHKHISSGLYIITKQVDNITISGGYKTTLSLTKIGGDDILQTYGK